MTNAKETIIKSALKYLVKMQIEQGSVGFAVDNDHDHDCCWDDILAWIEAQPSEDCISREAVINAVCAWGTKKERNLELMITMAEVKQSIVNILDELPPVTPKYSDEEIDKAQAVEQAYVDKMVELAVEEAKRPKGKWITWKEAGNYIPSETRFECSVCHDAAQTLCNGLDLLSPYCPNCGAEMEEG